MSFSTFELWWYAFQTGFAFVVVLLVALGVVS